MTLTKRVIPCLDVDKGRVVKGMHFTSIKDAGDPVLLAEKYSQEGADELVFLDITASEQNRETIKSLVKKVAQVIDIPFTVGGGVKTLRDARDILLSGADKVAINTGAVKNPEIITKLMEIFGKQCIVIAMDVRRNYEIKQGRHIFTSDSKKFWFEVYIYGGKTPTDLDAVEWAKEVERLGAGEILLTSIDMDGTKEGYDVQLIKEIVNAVNIPVIASGGCGKPKHMLDVFLQTNVDAALASSIFHYKTHSVDRVKEYIKENGFPVRL
jgi:cyclase